MASPGQSAVAVFPVSSYNFGQKDAKLDKHNTQLDKFQHMQSK